MCMNNSALKDIQQSLNIIRAEIEKVDAETHPIKDNDDNVVLWTVAYEW